MIVRVVGKAGDQPDSLRGVLAWSPVQDCKCRAPPAMIQCHAESNLAERPVARPFD